MHPTMHGTLLSLYGKPQEVAVNDITPLIDRNDKQEQQAQPTTATLLAAITQYFWIIMQPILRQHYGPPPVRYVEGGILLFV